MVTETRLQRVAILDPLRGLAALAVTWFHLTGVQSFQHTEGLAPFLRATAQHTWMGVAVFFVISGFVLPYAMQRGGYRLSEMGTFVKKRVVRLDPPYLAAIALVLAVDYLAWLMPGGRPTPPTVDPTRLLLHLGYLNAFFGQDWYNPVFWTLAIEFQFYLAVALLFPLLLHARAQVRSALPLVLASLALSSDNGALIIPWLGVFALGMAAFQHSGGLASRGVFLTSILAISAVNVAIHGWILASVVAATALVIVLAPLRRPLPGLTLLGALSYSLYLIHGPVGAVVADVALRGVHDPLFQAVVLLGAVCVSLAAAYVMYRAVERPSQQWSARFSYRNTAARAQTEPIVNPVAPLAADPVHVASTRVG
jgi:peptidoglycan/LPS O-acetylase OafA/YrhL